MAQINVQDSLVLIDLYNNTNKTGWYNHTNWLTAAPVTTWYGITVSGDRVVKITLRSNGISGTIPSSLGNLTNLQILDLGGNTTISGPIPASLGNLINLQSLIIDNATLTGSIPSSLGNLINLQVINLFNNQLSDSIPASLGNLLNLQRLYLNRNHLTGSIPSSLGNLTHLNFLYLETNELTDSLPSSLGSLINLLQMELNNNQLTGLIPASFGNLSNLQNLSLNSNQFNGSIPSSFGNLKKLSVLELSNNHLSGSLPPSLGDLSGLFSLSVTNNQLSDTIPSTFANLYSLRELFMNNNQLNGTIPASLSKLTNLQFLLLHNNYFTFNGMEQLVQNLNAIQIFTYSPQAIIKLHINGNTLSVSAGGTLKKDKFFWYKDKKLIKTAVGDSTLTFTETGAYHVKVKNSIAKQLYLFSDTINVTVLPVDLIAFTASVQQTTALLNWKTVNEINNNYFDIERSPDAKAFYTIGVAKGSGNANAGNYTFIDKSPLKGINYYRLKQVDKDGKFSYSNIISVEFANNNSLFTITPNPANTTINISIPASNTAGQIIIYNINGAKVISEKLNANISLKQLNISRLAIGSYIITLIQDGKKQTLKFIKR